MKQALMAPARRLRKFHSAPHKIHVEAPFRRNQFLQFGQIFDLAERSTLAAALPRWKCRIKEKLQ
ncbi:MAG TPA: hypothetical protein VFB31_17850 [Pseudolabrys sp.]|nr:hypothetical protein [Pseudolabrys sp.]